MAHNLSKSKARKMLHEGVAHGKAITKKQRGLFGLIASGKRPRSKAYRTHNSPLVVGIGLHIPLRKK